MPGTATIPYAGPWGTDAELAAAAPGYPAPLGAPDMSLAVLAESPSSPLPYALYGKTPISEGAAERAGWGSTAREWAPRSLRVGLHQGLRYDALNASTRPLTSMEWPGIGNLHPAKR